MAANEQSTKGTAEVARAYFAAVAERDVEGMIDLWRIGSGTGNIHGTATLRPPDDYRRWFGGLFTAFPDLRFDVLDLTCEGDKAAVRWSAKGSFTGPGKFEGLTANGKKVDLEGIDLLTIRDGLIDELHAYTNATVMMRQLGALPDSGSSQEKAMMATLNLKAKALAAISRR